mgnify:CR=1 FL=1
MDWLRLGIEIGVLIVTFALAWAGLKTSIALIKQDIQEIKGNHLKHMELSIKTLTDIVQKMEVTLARIDEKLKK